jgi:nitrite reductase/ring-hydroxylating ferredoxin subunit
VGLGVAAALPTAAAGLADWSDLNKPERRTGVVHAAANLVATALYGLSFLARRRGHRTGGVLLGLAGATAATAGGFLGGHLAYRRGAGVNQAAAAPAPRDWTEIQAEGTLTREELTLARLDGEPLAAAQGDSGPVALFDRCTHLAGPLHEGVLVDGCVRCPWHGSTFRMADGIVVHGPATATQPAYELRVDGERIHARRRPPH